MRTLTILLLLVGICAAQQPEPTTIERRAVEDQIENVFGDQLRRARTPQRRHVLGAELLAVGLDANDHAERFVLLERAAQLGSDLTQLQASTALYNTYDTDLEDVTANLLPVVATGDYAAGAWSRVQTGVQFHGNQTGTIKIPVELPPEYDLGLAFTRHNGVYRVAVFFPTGKQQVQLHLGANNGKTHGIGPLKGRDPADNITATANGHIANKQLHRAVVLVRRPADDTVHVSVLFDDKQIIDWHGPAEVLGVEGVPLVGVSIPGKCKVTLHALQVVARYTPTD